MLHLGTSGYCYPHWAKLFYEGVPHRLWLVHYAQVFRTVELNNTFYRLPSPEAVKRWREQTPEGFLFAVKGSRFLTHMKRLLDRGPGIRKFFDLAQRLGPRLGPVLWQLPPQMDRADPERLEGFLAALPREVRHVFEFRHEAWYTDEVCRVLDRYRAAFCEHDLVARRPPRLTGGFRYLRFHGASGRYRGRYGKAGLWRKARELGSYTPRHEAFVYFNNDLYGHALMDALDFSELSGEPVPLRLHPGGLRGNHAGDDL